MNKAFTKADLSAFLAYGQCRVLEVFGYNENADQYIMFFETPVLAVDQVPRVKPLYVQTVNGFKYSFPRGLDLSACYVGLSTDPTKYVAVGAGGGVEMTIVYETNFDATGVTVAGDLTTDVAKLDVWAADNTKKLLRVEVKNNDGALNVFMCVSGRTGAYTTAVYGPEICKPSATTTFNFGPDGITPYEDYGHTAFKSCGVFVVQSDPGDLGRPVLPIQVIEVAVPSCAIRALYK